MQQLNKTNHSTWGVAKINSFEDGVVVYTMVKCQMIFTAKPIVIYILYVFYLFISAKLTLIG